MMGKPTPDQRAIFGANFTGIYNDLIGRAINSVRHKQDAEDIVSRVALKAWRAWPTYTDQGNFQGWMHAILTNEIKDFHRENSRHPTSHYEPDAHDHLRVSEPDQEARHECRDVQRVIDTLDPDARAALIRTAVDGESDTDVAANLGVARATISSRVHRARKTLRRAAAI